MDKEDWHIHTAIKYMAQPYILSHKKNETMPFATIWMDQERIIRSELSHTEKDKYHVISFICGIQNMTQINFFYKTETDS